MEVHNAVLAVGIHRFAVRCEQRGQHLTPLAAAKIAAMARIIGVHATCEAAELGFAVKVFEMRARVLRDHAC